MLHWLSITTNISTITYTVIAVVHASPNVYSLLYIIIHNILWLFEVILCTETSSASLTWTFRWPCVYIANRHIICTPMRMSDTES